MAHHGQEAALEQVGLLGQTLSFLGRLLPLQSLTIEAGVLLAQLDAPQCAADLNAQGLIQPALARPHLEDHDAQLLVLEVERLDHIAAWLAGQPPVGSQLLG